LRIRAILRAALPTFCNGAAAPHIFLMLGQRHVAYVLLACPKRPIQSAQSAQFVFLLQLGALNSAFQQVD